MDDTSANATAVDAAEPQEHGNRLARNALGLAGNIGIALGSSASTASVALTLAAIVAVRAVHGRIGLLQPAERDLPARRRTPTRKP